FRQGRAKACRSRKIQTRIASVRRLRAAEGASGKERATETAGQFPLAFFWSVLRRAGTEFLHVPVAHAERYSQALAIRRRRRSGGTIWRRLLARHHARQSSDPRDRAAPCRCDGRGHSGTWP